MLCHREFKSVEDSFGIIVFLYDLIEHTLLVITSFCEIAWPCGGVGKL